ncbi:MAG: peptidase dimerization domain-containing protein [Anaerolineae bacterium]
MTIGSIHGGAATNVIPDEVTISGTMRSFDDGNAPEPVEGTGSGARRRPRAGRRFQLDLRKGFARRSTTRQKSPP